MFKNPFSFEGRIRRLEFGLSFIIYLAVIILTALILYGTGFIDDSDSSKNTFMLYFACSPAIWFIWAQGAKRCHDRDNSGWYELIPFYVLWMLFADGDPKENEYGTNPKMQDYEDPFEVQPEDTDQVD